MTPIPETVPPIEVRMAEIVFPNHTNHLGTLFGGQALAWMDKAAFLAAARYSRRTVVTARSDQVDFNCRSASARWWKPSAASSKSAAAR
jgi:acyl-CoA hydrolase